MSLVVRSSTKRVKALYILGLLLAAGILIYGMLRPPLYPWLFLVPAAVLLGSAKHHLTILLSSLTVEQTLLRYQSGLLSKTTRTVEIGKVQDVRVDQSLGQRMLSTGNLSLETAGGGSRLTMPDVDAPHQVADEILRLSTAQGGKGNSVS